MANELHKPGVIKHFNGLDIHQTRDNIKISCELYIDKMSQSHNGWENEKAANRRFQCAMTPLTEPSWS